MKPYKKSHRVKQKKCYVYQICYKQDINNVDKGYIGMTNSPAIRKHQHFTKLAFGTHKNKKIQNAFNKSGGELEFNVLKEFDNRKDAAILEENLRPHRDTAWNEAVGGRTNYKTVWQSKKYNIVDDNFVTVQDLIKDIKIVQKEPNILLKVCRRLLFPVRERYRIASAALILKSMMDENYCFENIDTRKHANLILCQIWQKKIDIFKGSFGNEPHKLTTALYCLAEYTMTNNLDVMEKGSYMVMCGNLIDQVIINGRLYGLSNVDMFLAEQSLQNYLMTLDELNNKCPVNISELEQTAKAH